MELEVLPFQVLREITDDFSEERKLGEGAFGVVYRGVTKTKMDVAVKMLKNESNNIVVGNKEFKNEIYNLAMLKHENIVQVLGYCYEIEKKIMEIDGQKLLVEEPHRAICLEYLHNGSLEDHLSDEFGGLDWDTRFKIIKGTSEGLKYILDELEQPIYHLDLKPSNILLDKNMVPKIADFGLSRISGKELVRTTQNLYGTLGYRPPEHIDRGQISNKFDIFSLGIVMIRILSGPEGNIKCRSMSLDEFIDQVKKNWRNRLETTCSSDSLLEAYCRQVETCTQIALECIEDDSQKRPHIVKITNKLNEIETYVHKLPQTSCHETISGTAMSKQKTQMRKKSKEMITDNFIDARETSSDVMEELIIGRSEATQEIIASLHERTRQKIIILPICGIGGIGKTTFAKLIYNHTHFKSYSHAWVYVSQRFDLDKIRKSIFSQLLEKDSQTKESHMVHNRTRLLIVLDDLWQNDTFVLEDLKAMVNLHESISTTVLVTARCEQIVEKICVNHKPYKLQPLSNDMCWDIIKQRSGFEVRDDKERLKGIGQEIALKCGGVALAAQTLGFMLRSMEYDQWMEVKDSKVWNESTSEDASLPNHVIASLKLSYNSMTQSLRSCFTYCAIFPKGHKIVKSDLVNEWISLDFIKPTKMLNSMQLCEKYIAHLLGLSFLEYSISTTGCKAYHELDTLLTMHDLVHDLAASLLGNQMLDQSKQCNTRGSSCQYALLVDCKKPLKQCTTSPASLRALRFLDCCGIELRGAAFSPAKSLAVLDLRGCSKHKLPDSIGQLRQLRYLNAPRIRNRTLPECITKLLNLTYLNLHGSSIVALPNSIGELQSLAHLDLSDCKKLKQLPGTFRKLEKLTHLDLSRCLRISGVSESLGSLSHLEHLNLKYCRNMEDLAGQLARLRELQYLNLARSQDYDLEFSICGLKQVLENLTKLRYLNLEGCLAEAESDIVLECLCTISNLEHLDLSWNHNLFRIPENLSNLSKLHTLSLSCCSNLKRLPDSLSEIGSLKYIDVSGCSSLVKLTLPQYKKSLKVLPSFVVHVVNGESRSNLYQLEYDNPTELEIIRLENVTSAKEARRIKLVEKQRIGTIGLLWTRDAKRFADDTEVLNELVPPDTVDAFNLEGYNSVSFPSWMMNITTYLPQLVDVVLLDLPSCKMLPPLGQLPNLMHLHLKQLDNIRIIDGDFYGGTNPFPKLLTINLCRMESLEEWNTECSPFPGRSNLLMFPNLGYLKTEHCPKLRFKPFVPQGGYRLIINKRSDQVLLSSPGDVFGGFSSPGPRLLSVECCEMPLHQWTLLRYLPYLRFLDIENCSDLTCSSTGLFRCLSSLTWLSVKRCGSIAALPESLAELTSLNNLWISECEGIKTLPESIQQLACLKHLSISDCPELVKWCKSRENRMKLAHIEKTTLDGKRLLYTKAEKRATMSQKKQIFEDVELTGPKSKRAKLCGSVGCHDTEEVKKTQNRSSLKEGAHPAAQGEEPEVENAPRSFARTN